MLIKFLSFLNQYFKNVNIMYQIYAKICIYNYFLILIFYSKQIVSIL